MRDFAPYLPLLGVAGRVNNFERALVKVDSLAGWLLEKLGNKDRPRCSYLVTESSVISVSIQHE